MLWRLLLAALVIAPSLATAQVPLTWSAERATAPVGAEIVVEVRADPGARVDLGGRSEVASERGIALFAFSRANEGAVDLTATSAGRAPVSVRLAWVAPRLVVDAPSIVPVGATSIPVRLVWGANQTPVAGAALGLHARGVLVDAAQTDAAGRASFILVEGEAGVRVYGVAADDPLFAAASSSFGLVWTMPADPAPPPPPEPLPPPAVVENRPPRIAAVRIAWEGGVAMALVDDVSDPDGDGVFLGYSWRVDGVPFFGPTVAARPGALVELTVVGADGRGGTTSVSARAVAPAAPPVARVEVEGARVVGRPLVFDGSASEGATSFAWRFNDGAQAESPRVERSFAVAGPVWAELVVTAPDGQTSTVRVDLVVREPPPPAGIEFRASDGAVYLIPPDVSVERVLAAGPSPRLLVASARGLEILDPAQGVAEPVAERAARAGNVSYAPRVVFTRADAPVAGGLVLARVPDPQPALPFLGAYDAAGAQLWAWRDGEDILVVGAEFVLQHALEPLALRAQMIAVEGAYRVTASALGGAPVARFRVVGPDGVVLDVTERAIEARLAPGTEDREFVVEVETLAGERAERRFTVPAEPADVFIQPAEGAGVEVGAAIRGAPMPGVVWLLVCAALLAASRRRF